jgi:O-antigen ligase
MERVRGHRGVLAALLGACAAAWAGGPAAGALTLIALTSLAVAYLATPFVAPLIVLFLPSGALVAHVVGAQVLPLEAAVGGCALGYSLGFVIRRQRPELAPVDWAFVAFVAAVAASTLGPADNSQRARDVLFWGALALVFHAIRRNLRTEADFRRLLVALAAVTLGESAYAIFEYLSRLSESFSRLGGAIVYPQPEGTLLHPNSLGAFLVFSGLLLVALGLGESGWRRRLAILASGAAVLATAVTFSRGAWISLAVGAFAFLLDKRARKKLLFVGSGVVAVAFAVGFLGLGPLGARISSLASLDSNGLYGFRLELAHRAVDVIGRHPLTGVGVFDEYGVYASRPVEATHPHDLFLGLAVFYGGLAAIAFLIVFACAVDAAWRAARRSVRPELRTRGAGLLAALGAVLVNGFFEYPFWNHSLTVLVVLVLAIAVAAGGRSSAPT